MERRRFGRTGHLSSVAIFGGVALSGLSQAQADETVEMILAAGVNHIDIAPSYGDAEERLGPSMPRYRQRFFLGCKTTEREADEAARELRASLKRLRCEAFDLYQLHAVNTMEELDKATRASGALEAIIEAQSAGLTRFIGITAHGLQAPRVLIEALRRFDFDSVLFPINFIQYANPAYRADCEELIALCNERDVGRMIIKSITRGPWGDKPAVYQTWYEPFNDREHIQAAVNFVLSQDVTGLCTVGDVRLLPLVLEACQNYRRLSAEEQENLIATAGEFSPLFARE